MRPVLIAGPTASGKSALALRLAERLGGAVINADSMQVYRDLRVITARPAPEEEARVPHLLYGHVDAAESYSAGQWCEDVREALRRAAEMGRIPIVTGGTGLYFKALTGGIAGVPPVPPGVRAGVRARLDAEGSQALHAELAVRDPAMAARLSPGDRSRVARALEVVLGTGRSLSEWQHDGLPPVLDAGSALKLFLDPPRDGLRARVSERFDAMLEAGALEEVRALDARGLDPQLPAMKAHGVPWLRRYLQGELPLDAAAEGGKADTRRYIKRQVTWFRHQAPGWTWVLPAEAEAAALQQISA